MSGTAGGAYNTSGIGIGIGIGIDGAMAHFTLDRPRALNALDVAMRAAMSAALPAFGRDPQVYALVIRSASERAFCAGGDVREILALADAGDLAAARRAFAEEYAFDWQLECFAKPTVALIDGMVVGSGVGLTASATHRVGGERYSFAMPETMIGLFPDAGVSHALARLPDETGLYLGLTGRSIGRADAYALGLLTHCIDAGEYPAICSGLADAWPVDPLLDERHRDPGPGDLAPYREIIATAFAAPTVPEIMTRLRAVRGAQAAWAGKVADDLVARSPLSLVVSLRHMRAARDLDLRGVLIQDYRLACRFLEGHDFREGVRALLVDKDKTPRWNPARLADVDPAVVDSYFAALDPDLALAERRLMQEATI
ncbi:MAG: enoyl-CoA hydratase/isomerase family protein [Hyphomicrobiaceae bacterium]|nr:enoyl-CoA hydratase/isomerase family protein [Hyphomicrobiaceae bacterium]